MAEITGFPPPPPPKEDGITETIHVPNWETASSFTPDELARICRQMSRLANYLAGSIMRVAGSNTSSLPTVGAAHPVVQQLFQMAATSENCAVQLEGPARIQPPGAMPGPGKPGGPFRC